MDAVAREGVRRLVDRERRRLLGAEINERGTTDMQAVSRGQKALALVAFEAAGGDPLLALDYALDMLARRRAAPRLQGSTAIPVPVRVWR